ncbi:MAG: hypothetical protein RLZZ196_2068 [Bacteroidota bacterium]|jgi:hypothetical protein
MESKNLTLSQEEIDILKEGLFKLQIKYIECSLYRFTEYLPLLSSKHKEKINAIKSLRERIDSL